MTGFLSLAVGFWIGQDAADIWVVWSGRRKTSTIRESLGNAGPSSPSGAMNTLRALRGSRGGRSRGDL